jgi:hypothetical protein
MSEASALNDSDDQALATLGRRVLTKRDEIDAYLAAASRRRDRLVNVTIFGGSIAAALSAAPALGGESFSDWLGEAFGLNAPAWQLLCLAAMLCSLAATIAAQLRESNNYQENIGRAQSARAALEALDVGIVSGHLRQRDATTQYLKCLEDVPFIDAREPSRPPHRG